MALGKIDPKKLWQGLKKYRYAALVLLLGLALLLLPGGKKTTQKSNAAASAAQTDYAAETERRLTQMLQQIAGAGQVSVMLTLETGERVEYQTDVQASSDGAQSSESRKTVILSEGSSYDKAAVAATTYPRFQGALIVCEGAGQRCGAASAARSGLRRHRAEHGPDHRRENEIIMEEWQ